MKKKIAIVAAAFALAGVAASAAFAAKPSDNGTRPGWGYGDKNHEHTGPPGQSVNPAGAKH